ncbi:dimethyl sulfoxide reductase anchor subunit family protein [Arenibacterium halophilum]|uniref:Dimethyl sulfoxide reductase anchor subunit n=1 Tax=Arenibacterium halophilum TaxID=2583821 RepID=A0ABY2XAS9_9RHOB|nr:DmsC/YnfH family molybdoenzyme membrane anchor subunit [Arenibacterium halophilum]TMV13471.1 dimethyl sulfoxide reductase anchor subunit [Arenibacterium halophilum]
MNPAYSVIFFTTASGAGYGLLVWLCLAEVAGLLPDHRWLPFGTLALALALATAGLLSSTFHLGHPERAWRALSQWRSSWLSREGVAALATYVPAGLLGLIWLFGLSSPLVPVLCLLSVAGAVATVWCTGMIYGSLRTIHQWNQPLVPVIYLALAAASGAVLLALILSVWGLVWPALLALVALGAALALKLAYFARIDGSSAGYTVQMALGLSPDARVRVLDPPHSRPNFVMREMGYQVGRRHATRLRRIALGALFGAPLVLIVVSLFGFAPALLTLAVLSLALGLIVERWLFFAEARHVSMLYYGQSEA